MPRVTVTQADVKEAVREQVKAAIGIDGLSGDGKSGLALELAFILSGNDWKKVHATDTENNALSLYVGKKLQSGTIVGKFYHAKMNKRTGYSPFNYEYFRNDAKKKKCTVAIMDSYTHMWYREGGVLNTVTEINAKTKKGEFSNKFTAWGHPDVVDGKNLIFDLIRDHETHVISTIRIKDGYAMQSDGSVKNIGLEEIQADGLKYEFDLLLRVVRPASTPQDVPAGVEVLKSRYDLFEKGKEYDMTPSLMEKLAEYLEKGTSREELDERMRVELIDGLKEALKKDRDVLTVFKQKYPNKVAEYDLETLRKMNSYLMELTT